MRYAPLPVGKLQLCLVVNFNKISQHKMPKLLHNKSAPSGEFTN